MLLIFTAAALIVTGAVWALAAVGGWWMLGVAFAVHVAMTAVVALEVVHVIDGRTFAIPHRSRTTSRADRHPHSRPQTDGKAATAA
jgi:membrane protein implicated in regulation of membrane protease activity